MTYSGRISNITLTERDDLDLTNHLSGLRRPLLKVSFHNTQGLQEVRRELQQVIGRNRARQRATNHRFQSAPARSHGAGGKEDPRGAARRDLTASIQALREHDVLYQTRVSIDLDLRAGQWYSVVGAKQACRLTHQPEMKRMAEPSVCAFDIETTKLPLQFPNSESDQVFMISYMIDGQGFLIINREFVGADVVDFEYTPRPEFLGPFTVINVADEKETLEYFFYHMARVKPGIYVTYNGDWFDWPFIETRAGKHGLDMHAALGFRCKTGGGDCLSRFALHMDCLHWVNRDSYLPQGSRGLKAVTKVKLGYNPVEVDPEDMMRLAAEDPQTMASYSVSDAVATYYLYFKYIHPFVFSLCSIIPMAPDDVLRKGSGTLCEMLLMVEASRAQVTLGVLP